MQGASRSAGQPSRSVSVQDPTAVQNAKIKRLVWSLLPAHMRADATHKAADDFDGMAAGRRKQTIKETLEASRRLQAERQDAEVWEQLELEAARIDAADSGSTFVGAAVALGPGGKDAQSVRPGQHKRQVMELQRKSRLFRERCASANAATAKVDTAVVAHSPTKATAQDIALPTLTVDAVASPDGTGSCPSPFALSSPITAGPAGSEEEAMTTRGAGGFLNSQPSAVSGLTPRAEVRIVQAGRSYSPMAVDYTSRRGYDEAREYEDMLAHEILFSAGGAGGGGFLAPASKIAGGDTILQQRAAKSIPALLEKELRRHTIEARVAERSDADGLLSSLREDRRTSTSIARSGGGAATVVTTTPPTTPMMSTAVTASTASPPPPTTVRGVDGGPQSQAVMGGEGSAGAAAEHDRRGQQLHRQQREQDDRLAARISAARAPFVAMSHAPGGGSSRLQFIVAGTHGALVGGATGSPMRRPPMAASGGTAGRTSGTRGGPAAAGDVSRRASGGGSSHDELHDEVSKRTHGNADPSAARAGPFDGHRSCGMQPCQMVASQQPTIDWTSSGPLGGSAAVGLARNRRRRSTIPVIDLAKDALNQYDKKERAKATRLVCLPFALSPSSNHNNDVNDTTTAALSSSAVDVAGGNASSTSLVIEDLVGGGTLELGSTVASMLATNRGDSYADVTQPALSSPSLFESAGRRLGSAASSVGRGGNVACAPRSRPQQPHRSVDHHRPGTAPSTTTAGTAPPPAATTAAAALLWPPKPSALSVVDQYGQAICLETFVPPTELSARTCILDATPQVAARDRVAVALQRLSPEPLPIPPSLSTMSPTRCRPGSAALSEPSSFGGGRPSSSAANLARRAESLGGSAMVRRWMQYQTLKPEDRVNASLPTVSRPATAQQLQQQAVGGSGPSVANRAASANQMRRQADDAKTRRKAIQSMFCRPKPVTGGGGAAGASVCQQRW